MFEDFLILCFFFPPTLSPAFLFTQTNMSHLLQKAKYFQDFYTIEESENSKFHLAVRGQSSLEELVRGNEVPGKGCAQRIHSLNDKEMTTHKSQLIFTITCRKGGFFCVFFFF